MVSALIRDFSGVSTEFNGANPKQGKGAPRIEEQRGILRGIAELQHKAAVPQKTRGAITQTRSMIPLTVRSSTSGKELIRSKVFLDRAAGSGTARALVMGENP